MNVHGEEPLVLILAVRGGVIFKEKGWYVDSGEG